MINQWLGTELVTALGWTVVHSLWQLSVLALIMSFLSNTALFKSARRRYVLSVSTMGIAVLTFITTFLILFSGSSEGLSVGETLKTVVIDQGSISESNWNLIAQIQAYFDAHTNLITQIWLFGVVLFSIRLLGGYAYLQQFVLGIHQKNEKLSYLVNKLTKQLGVNKSIPVYESEKVSSPMIIGYLKPLIMVPVGLVNCLEEHEVEAILFHELAHVLRHDFLVNLFVSLSEVLLFYHPGAWWIASNIRYEREHCCDDLAIKHFGNSLEYAKVLLKLEQLGKSNVPNLALGMASQKKNLLYRVKRILNQPYNISQMKEKVIATLFVFAMIFTISLNGNNLVNDRISDEITRIENTLTPLSFDREPAKLNVPIVDTFPTSKRQSVTISEDDGEESFVLKMENGEVKKFIIDGREVPPSEYDKHITKIEEMKPHGGHMRHFNLDGDHPMAIFADSIELWFDDGDLDSMIARGMPRFQDFDVFAFPEGNHFESFNFDFDTLMRGFKFDQHFNEEEMSKHWEELSERLHSMPQLEEEHLRDMLEGFHQNDFLHVLPDGEFEHVQPFELGGNKLSDKIGRELNRDGLLEIGKANKVELSGKHLKINGDKQPKNIWSKYKMLYEENTGAALTKNSKIELDIMGKKSKRLKRLF